jgi:hypothetical protein
MHSRQPMDEMNLIDEYLEPRKDDSSKGIPLIRKSSNRHMGKATDSPATQHNSPIKIPFDEIPDIKYRTLSNMSRDKDSSKRESENRGWVKSANFRHLISQILIKLAEIVHIRDKNRDKSTENEETFFKINIISILKVVRFKFKDKIVLSLKPGK